ncbi:MAG: CRTAC1 family protein [Bryobacterales bacterium]|nr:CRTAC1 family protein [Bryobacterales bacterium]
MSNPVNRRQWLALASGALASGGALGQGVASRGVRAAPRGKPSGLPFHARFTNVAAQAGLTHPGVYGAPDNKQYIVETIGCGIAFIDYDNDGWLDIFVLNGTRFGGAPESVSNRLYKNNRDGTFTDVTQKAGLIRQGWASAVCAGDVTGNGYADLFITYWGQNVLYRNNGDGTFTDITKASGLELPRRHWGAGCSFLDFDRDGKLDLFVTEYVDFDPARVPKPGGNSYCNWKGIPVNCGPLGLPPGRHWLYRGNGDGTFTDVTEKSGVGKAKGSYGMTAVAADFDNDGWPDIYVACDSTPSFLFRNNHDGTFSEVALENGVALNEDGMEQAGMGIGAGDYDLDGDLDVFKTHFADDTNVLYRNDGKGNFQDMTIRSGLGVETRFIGWGAGIQDLDNDGHPDLFFVTGNVYPEVERKLPRYAYRTPRIIFRNLGNGTFEELLGQGGPALEEAQSSRGCAFGDFDNDGDVDIVVWNMDAPPSLLRNDVNPAAKRHWIKVKLEGVTSNRSAIGGRVTVIYGGRRQTQEVMSQGSFYSVNDWRLHFGLGDVARVDLEVRWPSGKPETFRGVQADRLIVIREGQGIVRTSWTP